MIVTGIEERLPLPGAAWGVVLMVATVMLVATMTVVRLGTRELRAPGVFAGLVGGIVVVALIVGVVLAPHLRRLGRTGRRLWTSPPATCRALDGGWPPCEGNNEIRLVVTAKGLLLVTVRGDHSTVNVALTTVRSVEVMRGHGTTEVHIRSTRGDVAVHVGKDLVLRRRDLRPSLVRTLQGLGASAP